MKRSRKSITKAEKPRFFIAPRSDPKDEKRCREKAMAVGSVVEKMSRSKKRATTSYLVSSYLDEWGDELDEAQENHFLFVNEEFLDHMKEGLSMEDVLALPGTIDHNVWDKRRLELDYSTELPFPQSFAEFNAMPERLRFGRDADGSQLVLADMSHGDTNSHLLPILRDWCSAFFMSDVRVLEKKLGLPGRRKKRYSYDVLLEQLWSEKEECADCYAIIGITDADIYDEETNETIYGRATGDGGGVVSSFHFETDVSVRCFLSTAVHETLHVFGIDHCSVWQCLMNSACDDANQDSTHMSLCPCCFGKLQSCIGFDPVARYNRLVDVAKQLGLLKDADFVVELRDCFVKKS